MKIKNRPIVQPGVTVVVRSWGGEPVELFLYSVENNGNTAIVGKQGGRHRIGVPVSTVYPFDPDFWAEIHDAHTNHRMDDVNKIYADWTNKVLELQEPIAIHSSHGQEHVARPECSPRGSK